MLANKNGGIREGFLTPFLAKSKNFSRLAMDTIVLPR